MATLPPEQENVSDQQIHFNSELLQFHPKVKALEKSEGKRKQRKPSGDPARKTWLKVHPPTSMRPRLTLHFEKNFNERQIKFCLSSTKHWSTHGTVSARFSWSCENNWRWRYIQCLRHFPSPTQHSQIKTTNGWTHFISHWGDWPRRRAIERHTWRHLVAVPIQSVVRSDLLCEWSVVYRAGAVNTEWIRWKTFTEWKYANSW